MAFWNSSQILTINDGANANDGTGDAIRSAFIKVNENFANISAFLASAEGDATVSFQNLQVTNTLNANTANVIVANITVNNVVGNTSFYGNSTIFGNILPGPGGTYNLGSPAYPFANLYVTTTVSTSQISQSTSSGILQVHANIQPADVQDVGILGNISNNYTSNAYAFFGHQYVTGNFVYKITPNNAATIGNGVVYDGVYGNAQLGGLFLSNSTISNSYTTGALIVNGGAGIGGNLNVNGNATVTGNMYVAGGQVITTNSPGLGAFYSAGSIFTSAVLVNVTTPSTNSGTGALVVQGGLGVGGSLNVYGNVASSGFVGQVYGIQNSMTSLSVGGGNATIGVDGTINASHLNSTSLGVTNITATGTLNFGSATISALPALTVTGNITAGNVSGGQFTGSVQGTVLQASQTNITQLGQLISLAVTGNVTAGNVSGTSLTGTLNTPAQPYVTSVGTLTALNTSGNINTSTANVITNAIYTNNYRFANGLAYVSTSIANTTEIVANVPNGGAVGLNLAATTVTAGTYGSATQIPQLVIDSKGRVTGAANVGVSTTITLAGGSGSGSVSGGGTLTYTGGTGISTSIAGSTVTITNTGVTSAVAGADITVSGATGAVTIGVNSTLATVTGRGATTSTALTFNGQLNMGASIVPTANVTYNLGSSDTWFNTFYGVSTQALYADLAENYQADQSYDPGTVLVFGGDAEVTTSAQFADVSVAGAVSTDPAYLMNGGLTGDTVVAIALRGRIPVKVIGPVYKGDLLVTAGDNPGHAVSIGTSTDYPLAVFAKSIETNTDEGVKVITAVIL
jgi:hypothetical protein